jgi:hypothetical protein
MKFNMRKNMLMVSLIAVMTLLVVSVASAGLATDFDTDFNGVELSTSGSSMASDVAGVVPVRVTFEATENASDVKVKVYMEGHRDDVSASTSRFSIEDGNIYTKLLSLRLPSDSDDLSEEYTLYVEVISKNDRSEIQEYSISVQREDYTLEVLSVDYTSKVSSDDVFPVSVVVKNTGYNELDDTYVVVSIPALGVSARGYVGDLVTTPEDRDSDDEEDSMQHTVYLKIPADAESGVYDLEIEAYNSDANAYATRLIAVEGEDVEDSDAADADDDSVSTSVVVLTVILAIIFVVLLAVLVVLLTRKEKTIEEVETSYY